ncbi:MAG: Bcr/CflA family efflux MFS transporter [Gammaproteobacteria bacterium]|nr:MAG: Bcr/CflA family efflux MFS transporter [Gammaproteobacteria bacterium]
MAGRPSLVLLSLASGLSPFGMAVIVPALALFVRDLGTTEAQAALVVSTYLIGLTLAQPLLGTLCDRFGRRPVLLCGFVVFVVASLVCAAATELWVLLLGRLFQALGVSVGTVAARAVVRDTREGMEAAEAMAWISAIMGVAPVFAPMIGGLLGVHFGWQSIFLFSAAVGTLVLGWVALRMPETRPAGAPASLEIAATLRGYAKLLSHRGFLGFTLVFGFCNAAFFAFLATGAAIFERDLGLGPDRFGLIWGALSVAYIVGAALGGFMIRRWGIGRTLRFGVGAAAVLSVTMPLVLLTAGVDAFTLLVPLTALMACNGIIGPQGLAGAVSDQPELAGTAAGLSSSLGLLLCALFAALAGALYSGNALVPIGLISLAMLATLPALGMTGLLRPGREPAQA